MNKFILEKKEFYKKEDKVVIEYWYNDIITIVKILDIKGKKYLVTHNIPESNIQNAPDEFINSSDIIDKYR